jgi:hypothetical protein
VKSAYKVKIAIGDATVELNHKDISRANELLKYRWFETT